MLLGLVEIFILLNAIVIIGSKIKEGKSRTIYEHNLVIPIVMIVALVLMFQKDISIMRKAIPQGEYSVPIIATVHLETGCVDMDGIADIQIKEDMDMDGNQSYIGYVTDIYVEDTSITTDNFWYEFYFDYNSDAGMDSASFEIESDERTYHIDVESGMINHDSLEISISEAWSSRSFRDRAVTILFYLGNIISIAFAMKTEFDIRMEHKKKAGGIEQAQSKKSEKSWEESWVEAANKEKPAKRDFMLHALEDYQKQHSKDRYE